MLRQDFILREIERTVEFCLRAIGLKRADAVEELQDFLEENCEALTGLRLGTLLKSPSAKLVQTLYHPGTAMLPQLVSCGAWLCEAADVSLLSGRHEEARDLYRRGAEILAFLSAQHGEEDEFALVAEHLGRLRERIDDYKFPPEDRARVDTLLGTRPPS